MSTMRTHKKLTTKRGFTLMELMVAMAITTIIVSVLVSITSIALETWNRSRAELRASRQAKAMIEVMASDFESMVIRSGNTSEWLVANANPSGVDAGSKLVSSNYARLIFFTAATDRYDGDVGGDTDEGGDVSCVGYGLEYRDPIETNGEFKTYVLNRRLVNPDVAFTSLLGEEDLESAFSSYTSDLSDSDWFVCENVYQFTITFYVEVAETSGSSTEYKTVPITVGRSSDSSVTSEFSIKGTGIEASGYTGSEDISSGRLSSMELSVTVLTDYAVDQVRRGAGFADANEAEFISKNSFHFSKVVELPSM